MAETYRVTRKSDVSTTVLHPLEPLRAEEIATAVHIVRTERHLSEQVRFVLVALHEPSREVVLSFKPGDPIGREAFMVLLDKTGRVGAAYQAVVSVTGDTVTSWRHLLGVQPPIMLEEFFACEQLVRAHPDFQDALRKRGTTNVDRVPVDPWSAGNYGAEEENTRRISRATAHSSMDPDDPNDNSYAHPIEGLLAIVDLNAMEGIKIVDNGIVPLPPLPGKYTADSVGRLRTDLKPLEISQPEGPSSTVRGHEVHWQKWRFRIGFTPREGLVLYTVGYEDQERTRPIIYRAALAEMVVPYGDASPNHCRQSASDVGNMESDG